jgi:hypothetical protein
MTTARALAQQQLRRTQSINTLVRLRKEARDEISRLIEFLDASDEYVGRATVTCLTYHKLLYLPCGSEWTGAACAHVASE